MSSFDPGADDPLDADLWGLDEPFDVPSDAAPASAPASETAVGDDIVSVLDSETTISGRDPDRVLWALATTGSQVRHAVVTADTWERAALVTDLAPRAVLVVTDPSIGIAGAVLAELGCQRAPVLDWRGPELPRWAGPADVLLAASVDGRHPRVATLVAEADRRGLTVVAVSPEDSPVAAAAGHGIRVPVELPASPRAALWPLFTPLLLALDALGVIDAPAALLEGMADELDSVAEGARPGTDAFTNAAKQLAIEFAEAEPVLVACGPVSRLAVGRWAGSLALMAGVGAIALGLPEDIATAGALLEIPPAGSGVEDPAEALFRDRVESPPRRRRLVVVAETEAPSGNWAARSSAETGPDLHELAAGRAAGALFDVASARGLVSSTLDVPGQRALARFASTSLFGDFVAAYLAIGRGIDPGAVRAGELPY